ncbi:MAG: tetratricopeptide repeat protein [Gemmatimonadota bacterium]|nr:MAG: tetratricopeptide repeat protein [Gemmatimonadota bacterium]
MVQRNTSDEDRFVASTFQVLNWAQKHTRALVVGAVALAIGLLAVRYYVDFQKQVREAASTEIRNVRAELLSGDASQVVDQLRAFLVQYEGSDYAQEARVLLAHSLLLSNRASEAIEPARQAMSDVGRDPLSTRAAFLLAAAFEEVGDTAGAIQTYERIGERERSRVLKTRGLEGAARLRAAFGDRTGAVALYHELAALTPEEETARRMFYEMRAAELGAKALGAQGSGTEEAEVTG